MINIISDSSKLLEVSVEESFVEDRWEYKINTEDVDKTLRLLKVLTERLEHRAAAREKK